MQEERKGFFLVLRRRVCVDMLCGRSEGVLGPEIYREKS